MVPPLEAAKALIMALELTFGEITIAVANGEVSVIRASKTLKPADLEGPT